MKKTLCFFFCFFCLAEMSASAEAHQYNGWYIDVNGGFNNRENADDELAEAIFDSGHIIGGAVGYRFNDLSDQGLLQDIRLELAYNRQFNDLDNLRLHPQAGMNVMQDASGSIDTDSVQTVLYYDLPINRIVSLGSFWSAFKPYIGVGLGFNRSILNGLSCDMLERFTPAGDYPLDYETKWSPSYSLRGGVSYEVNQHWSIYAGGYYLKVDDHVVVEAPDAERDATHNVNGLKIATHPPVETSGMVMGIRFYF